MIRFFFVALALALSACSKPSYLIPAPASFVKNEDEKVFTDGPVTSNLLAFEEYDQELGEEGYELRINEDSVQMFANTPAGLFYGGQLKRFYVKKDQNTFYWKM